MTAPIAVSPVAKGYMVAGYGVGLDLGAGKATLHVYGTSRPPDGDPAGGAPLVIITLAKPSHEQVGNQISLSQDVPGGDLIANSGDAVWGRLYNGDGVWFGDGNVTDLAGAGPFKLGGVAGIHLYAGGYATLGSARLG
jgi:hypothetical protein